MKESVECSYILCGQKSSVWRGNMANLVYLECLRSIPGMCICGQPATSFGANFSTINIIQNISRIMAEQSPLLIECSRFLHTVWEQVATHRRLMYETLQLSERSCSKCNIWWMTEPAPLATADKNSTHANWHV